MIIIHEDGILVQVYITFSIKGEGGQDHIQL